MSDHTQTNPATPNTDTPRPAETPAGPVAGWIAWCLSQKLVVAVVLVALIGWGMVVAPLGDPSKGMRAALPHDPVPVDAIPDIGENQQIVFTPWPGRSPQDIDDQITYPLTVAMLGIPGVKDIRSESRLGFSMVYVVFKDGIDFYWSRSRLLEKLNALPAGTLPEGVQPMLGPDATGLGQVYWYTLEGRDPQGHPTGGWDLNELRTIQDFTVKYQLAGVEGVSEVASIGGHVNEYQIDVDPDAMRAASVTLNQIIQAVRKSNLDVGARTLEVNRVEYLVRGLGFIKSVEDLEQTAITARDGQPVLLKDIAKIGLGPADRRGVLTKSGVEAVGGVVVARYGENPMATIQRVKDKIDQIAPGLPRKTLADGTESQLTVVPFYDRSGLIQETLHTLDDAITQQVWVTVVVVVLMVWHARSSLLIGAMLPLAVLITFIAMKVFGVDANIVALSGIAIAIGTVVDMGIVLCENMLRHLEDDEQQAKAQSQTRTFKDTVATIHRACSEVGSAVLTAVATTVVGFLPVFAMQGAEGKLFQPLAFTKTFALVAAIGLTLTALPVAASLLFGYKHLGPWLRKAIAAVAALLAIALGTAWLLGHSPLGGLSHTLVASHAHGLTVAKQLLGAALVLLGVLQAAALFAKPNKPSSKPRNKPNRPSQRVFALLPRLSQGVFNGLVVALVLLALSSAWEPMGPEAGFAGNLALVVGVIGGLLLAFAVLRWSFPRVLAWCLVHKIAALLPAGAVVVFGWTAWLGFDQTFGWLPESIRSHPRTVAIAHALPGFGSEFMPSLDEGSFLYMPTTMAHASIGEATDILKELDQRILSVPEVESSVGKIGRVDSPLDPAPLAMVETLVAYKSEFKTDTDGNRLTFAVDDTGAFVYDDQGQLVEDPNGAPFRQWRDHIQSPDDIWEAIRQAADMPGVTSAPKLQPIETRLVMLQSGIRAPMAIKVFGPDLATIQAFGLALEDALKQVPSIEPVAVFADRSVGKPYLEIEIDREKIARYGLQIADVQNVIEVAIGGKPLSMSVEGRERFPIRVRYLRELRDSPDTLTDILVPIPLAPGSPPTMDGTIAQVPLGELATVHYRPGPQVIKSEGGLLVGHVLFDKKPGMAEVDVVHQAQAFLNQQIDAGRLVLPSGVSYQFTGSYQNQVRAAKRLAVVLPVSLVVIFLLLYLQFRNTFTTAVVFSNVFVAWGGGFLMLWLYQQPWFMDTDLFGVAWRQLFQVQPYNLSVAVWVGFLALFGIATDDGVIMATRIRQALDEAKQAARAQGKTLTQADIRQAVCLGGNLRVRAAIMTSVTTILALLPVLTSTGRGSDIMVPMAIPTFGGMAVASLGWFAVPVLLSFAAEWRNRAAK